MSTTWILIANASKAHLYEVHKALLFQNNGSAEKSLKLIKEFHHDESRMKNADLVTDKQGNFQTNNNKAGHGSMVEATRPKTTEAERFAKELAEELNQGRMRGRCDDVVLVASPAFKGMLNKHLHQPLSRMVTRTIEKDYTQLTHKQLAAQLREQI